MAVSRRALRVVQHSAVYLIISVGAVALLFPLLWTLSTSLKSLDQVTVREIDLIPNPVAWRNYIEVFQVVPVLLYFRNTMTIVVCAIFGAVVVCSMVGYAFARIDFTGREVFFMLLLSTMMLPGVIRLIPLFVIFDRLGWINTFLPLVVPRFLGHNPFYIFLYRQFFRGIPRELSDAARIDGCSEFNIWLRIVMPISKPVLAAVTVFSFQFAWNDFLSPLIYVGTDESLWTLALALNAFRSFEGDQRLHHMMVMSVLMIVPMLLLFAFSQRQFIRGVTFSGIQG
jgi:ABC-type glycerol-3-phosphate transport system permease component